MATKFISSTTVSGTGTSVVFARPDDVQEGDILVAWIVASVNTTATRPDRWMHRTTQPSNGNTFCVIGNFAWAEESEPTTYTFTLGASSDFIGILSVYRGVFRGIDVDPVLYPYGHFQIYGDGTVSSYRAPVASALLNIVEAGAPSTGVPYCRVMFLYAQEGATPKFDDPSPLVPIRAKIQTATLAMFAGDIEYADATPTINDVSVRSTHNGVWVTQALILEPEVGLPDTFDNYKSKLLRQTMPPPYDTRITSNLGKLLTVIGTSDNEVGGLYGSDDFLPDEA